MQYTVQASVCRVSGTSGNGICSVQVPTFVLDSGFQGIVSLEHAAQIAYDMLKAINPEAGVCLSICDSYGNTVIKHNAN